MDLQTEVCWGQNSFRGACGKPIKKLQAEEMTKESESKRRSPSIIARLMGLDGLPSPQHGHRPKRKASDKRQQNNTSMGIHQTEHPVEGPSSRRSPVDQQEFKDVYEDLEASRVSNHRYLSTRVSDYRLGKSAVELVQQNAKRLLSSERIHVPKESEDTLEILDFDKEFQCRYPQQPDSLFIKHVCDFTLSNFLYNHVESLEQSNLAEYGGTAKVWKSERGNERRVDASSRRKREDGLLLLQQNHHKSCKSCHLVENRFNAEFENDMRPTKIVVLKPNLEKTHNSSAPVPLPRSSHTNPSSFKKHLECRRAKADEVEKRTKRNSSNGSSFSKVKRREDRELARLITRQMRENLGPFGHDLITSVHSGARGYAGDESSYDVYGSDSSSCVEGMVISSRSTLDGTNCFKGLTSGASESSVTMEAKKRLLERWKMSQRCQDVEPLGKASTLGEMLAAPDGMAGHEHLDAALNSICSTECSSGYHNHQNGPLGISSKDGWKDGCIRNSSRSQSLSCSSYSSRGYNTDGQNEAPIGALITDEKTNRGRRKSKKGIVGQKEHAVKIIKTSTEKLHPCYRKSNDGFNSFLDENLSQIQTDICRNKQGEEEELFLPSGGSAIPITCLGSDVNFEDASLSSGSSVNLYCNQSDMVQEHNSCAGDQDVAPQEPLMGQSDKGSASLLCAGPEPEYSENTKESDHPSPVSVLRVSFPEDLSSSSDCFETVSAELHELRMQLQLLKMESGNYRDTPVFSSSDEDSVQQSGITYDEKCIFSADGWKSTYIDDVLINSGLEVMDQDMFLAAWHSVDCPLDPWVFDIVEKRHWEDAAVTKLERKLLFDSMNLALLEAFQEFVDPHPWVKPMWGRFILKSQSLGVKDALHKFLVEQEKSWNGDRQAKGLDRDMNWLRLEDGIDVVGKELEELLVNDLIGEVIM